jgi:DNA-binding SARP family transcriptional activator
LELQPTTWIWHVRLMRAFADAGGHRRALRQYQRLKTSQAAHGRLVALPEAEELYERLIAEVA